GRRESGVGGGGGGGRRGGERGGRSRRSGKGMTMLTRRRGVRGNSGSGAQVRSPGAGGEGRRDKKRPLRRRSQASRRHAREAWMSASSARRRSARSNSRR